MEEVLEEVWSVLSAVSTDYPLTFSSFEEMRNRPRRLRAYHNYISFVEGNIVIINGERVTIKHVTLDGFLYVENASSDDSVVVIQDGISKSFYPSWDHLTFISCEVRIE